MADFGYYTRMNNIEPIEKVQLNDSEVTLLGTAHVSKSSAEAVEKLLASGTYNAVAVELCPSRYNAIINPDALAQMDFASRAPQSEQLDRLRQQLENPYNS